jgi:hypothetical protein
MDKRTRGDWPAVRVSGELFDNLLAYELTDYDLRLIHVLEGLIYREAARLEEVINTLTDLRTSTQLEEGHEM